MPNPYGRILTGAGLLNDGKLTEAARARYVAEVLGLLATGNGNGRGGLPTTRVFSSLVPLPPIPGPSIVNVTTLASEPLFWFEPDPLATLMSTTILDRSRSPIWNAIFPDLLYASTAAALDASGATPLFPIFDASVAFPEVQNFPVTLPDLAIKAQLTPVPILLLKLAKLGIKVQAPSLPLPPLPPDLPDFLALMLPEIQVPGLPKLALIDLIVGLIKLPFSIIAKLVAPPDLGVVLDLTKLKFDAVFKLGLDIVVDLLAPLIPIVPKLLIASVLIYLKNVVAMVCVDVVGLVVGAEGVVTKAVAAATGLL